MRVCLAQMRSTADLSANLAAVRGIAARASGEGADLLCLPESALYRGPFEPAAVERLDGPAVRALAGIARENGLHVSVGGLWTQSADPARPYNTHLVLAPDGAVMAAYHKLHLFRLDDPDCTEDESACTTAGQHIVTVDVLGIRIGLSICYDLRFPELYRALYDRGATVLLIPSNFSRVTGQGHWEPLLRARAIENLCYVLAPAQFGSDSAGFASYGHTMAIDPWGAVLRETADGPAQVVLDIDEQVVGKCRRRLRSPDHRRADVYGGMMTPVPGGERG